MKYAAAQVALRQRLAHTYEAGEAAAIAALALEAITGTDRNLLGLHGQDELSAAQAEQLAAYTERLAASEPVQYVTGSTWFANMNLYVDASVLIPRPETEELVDWIVKDVRARLPRLAQKGPLEADQTATLKILDIGTGSGCIALALKKALPLAEVWGCDISDAALNVARRNGSDLNIRVDFQGIDFLDEDQQRLLPSVDILVSNPPYIPERDKETMHDNVLRFEPHTALFVPDEDALLFYRAIARFAKRRLHPGGSIYLEIHESLGAATVELFQSEGYSNIELRKDMQGKDRMLRVICE